MQGIGGGALMSVNIALVRMIYPAERLGRGVGLNALVVGVAFSLGPPWPRWCWRWPRGRGCSPSTCRSAALALVFAWQALPRTEQRGQRFDPLTAMLTAVTFAALIFALGAAAQREPWPWVLWPLATAIAAGALLLRRQAGDDAPMLPVDLLRRPLFALSAVTSACSFTTQGIAFVALPFYFEGVLHRDPVADRLPDLALADRRRDRRAVRRAPVRPLPAGRAGRRGPGPAERRHGVAGLAAGRPVGGRHRRAHGASAASASASSSRPTCAR